MHAASLIPAFLAALAIATPSLAAWETQQTKGYAVTKYQGERYSVTISCSRGSPLQLTLTDATGHGDTLDGINNLMVWIRVPDGRTDRWPVSVVREGTALSGLLVVSDFNLEFFRNAESFEIDSPGNFDFIEGDMSGSGAARLAFLERSGL